MTAARLGDIREAIRRALRGMPVAGCLVYGSVARGDATPASDLDTFVLLAHELTAPENDRLRAAFLQLQRRLGLTADADHPVELFSIAAVRRALATIERCLAAGAFHALAANCDEREVLHALTGARLVIRPGRALDELASEAQRINSLVQTEISS